MPDSEQLNSILSIQEGITFIDLSKSSSNTIDLDWYYLFRALIQSSLNNPECKALIIAVGDDYFSPALDENILQIYALLEDVYDFIAKSKLPVIAAIPSVALDTAIEFAMHCHYRVASLNAKIGFTSIQNGLIPGLGGTQLLPRLIGVEQALNILHRSTELVASELAGSDMFDELTEGDVLALAYSLAKQKVEENDSPQRARKMRIKLSHAQAFFDIARMNVGGIHKGNKAAMACIDCLEAAVLQPLEKGLKFEQAKFRQQLIEYKNNLLDSGETV